MSLGDIISDISATNTQLNVQPAGTIELVMTGWSSDGVVGVGCFLSDGVNDNTCMGDSTGADSSLTWMIKLGITNAHWLYIQPAGAGRATAFTAIQTRE
jgi:hypothetical protein